MGALDRPTIDQALEVLDRASKTLDGLCQGKRFTMTIPVQNDDTDIILGDGIYIGNLLLKKKNALENALKMAIRVIKNYQADIRNSKWTGVDLVGAGFCQGEIYIDAVGMIERMVEEDNDRAAKL